MVQDIMGAWAQVSRGFRAWVVGLGIERGLRLWELQRGREGGRERRGSMRVREKENEQNRQRQSGGLVGGVGCEPFPGRSAPQTCYPTFHFSRPNLELGAFLGAKVSLVPERMVRNAVTPRKALRGGISKSFFQRPCHFLAMNAHKMAPRTNQWLQERTWNAPT